MRCSWIVLLLPSVRSRQGRSFLRLTKIRAPNYTYSLIVRLFFVIIYILMELFFAAVLWYSPVLFREVNDRLVATKWFQKILQRYPVFRWYSCVLNIFYSLPYDNCVPVIRENSSTAKIKSWMVSRVFRDRFRNEFELERKIEMTISRFNRSL